MPSNYQEIAKDQIVRHGTEHKTKGKFFAEELYSDRSQFIFELLQNAEDAYARRSDYDLWDEQISRTVSFALMPDRLEVRHFGVPFTESDVRSICDVLQGTKSNDQTQIGRFGIGFKSVFSITETPEIHSGDEHFAVHDYIKPKGIHPRITKLGETLFVFPFTHPGLSAVDAFSLIAEKLSDLGPRTVLFLKHITEIIWTIADGSSGHYIRSTTTRGSARVVEVASDQTYERWIVFNRASVPATTSTSAPVEVAFRLEVDKQSRERIEALNTSYLVVTFPTKLETQLGFLLNGPFETTPSREGIKETGHNVRLIQESAKLVGDTLPLLRDMELLTVDLLNALPIRPQHFPSGSRFRPIFEQVRVILKRQKLLPGAYSGHLSGDQAKLAESADIRGVFSANQLRLMFSTTENPGWISGEITRRRYPDLYVYLLSELSIDEVTLSSVCPQLTQRFFESMSDDWIVRFYTYVHRHEMPSSFSRAIWMSTVLQTPLIRLENGTHVRPFDGNGNPQAYLPSTVATGLPTVSRSIVSQGEVHKLLTDLGIAEPDLVDDVIKNVLPKYRHNHTELKSLGGNEHLDDVKRILDALSPESVSKSLAKVQGLRNTLRNLPFLLCGNAANAKDIRYVIPDNVYLPSPELQRFFAGNPNAWFLNALYDRVPEMTSRLGLNQAVKVTVAPPQSSGHVRLKSNHGDHERGLNEFDPNCTVDGLDHALQHIDVAKSAFIWNELLPRLTNQISGTVEHSSKQSFENPTRKQIRSKMGDSLLKTPWLPGVSGKFVFSKDITQELLPDEFIPNDQLAAALGMNQRLLHLAEESGLSFELLQTMQIHQKEFEEYAQRIKERELVDKKRPLQPARTSTVDTAESYQERFSRPAAIGSVPNERSARPLKNPELRRARVDQEILQARHDEPTLDMRTRTMVTKEWEAKDPQVRSFLKEEYAGKCQTCTDSFLKRDGAPYFECVYLESQIAARWIDRPGNVICLCASCSAKFQHGSVEIVGDVLLVALALDDRRATDELRITLCGNRVSITYSQRHLIDLQGIARELAGR